MILSPDHYDLWLDPGMDPHSGRSWLLRVISEAPNIHRKRRERRTKKPLNRSDTICRRTTVSASTPQARITVIILTSSRARAKVKSKGRLKEKRWRNHYEWNHC